MYVPYIALELCLNAKCQMVILNSSPARPGKFPTPNRNKSEYSVPLNVQMYPAEEVQEEETVD